MAFAQGGDFEQGLRYALPLLGEEATEREKGEEAEVLTALVSLAPQWPVAMYLVDLVEVAVPGGAENGALEAAMQVRGRRERESGVLAPIFVCSLTHADTHT